MPRKLSSRRFQLTINNPKEHDYTHEHIRNILNASSNIVYWCMCDEIGEQETLHTHIYIVYKNQVMFATLQRQFYGAHIEATNGSHIENRDYIRKEGKWLDDAKHETNLIETFEEFGEMPPDREAGKKQNAIIYEMVKEGKNNYEILEELPTAINKTGYMDNIRQIIRNEEQKNNRRKLDVTFIYGDTGVGKTRYVLDKYGDSNVYRVTSYKHPFDGYNGEDVLLLDEFNGQIDFDELLMILDVYAVRLPCRYADKQACYTKVFILSNNPLKDLYWTIQTARPKSWDSLKRRINHEIKMLPKSKNGLDAWTDNPNEEDIDAK